MKVQRCKRHFLFPKKSYNDTHVVNVVMSYRQCSQLSKGTIVFGEMSLINQLVMSM